ncbi:thermonuclease family protein [Ectorhizobium quercum]|nr:thermonuclease family protein [Ectorhizobium quercum]
MREFAAMIFQVALVVFLAIIAVRVATVIGTGPSAAPVAKLTAGTESLWPTYPVRVETRRQDFERLPTPPDPFPLKLRADFRLRVTANNAFTYQGEPFRLAGVEPVERNRVCTTEDGRRYACGLNAFKRLENTVRRRYLECRIVSEDAQGKTVECVINNTDLRDLLAVAIR